MVALFRFFGLNVDDNFRWPLLATSPVQLWRRWNIYNRKLLLKFVYFPLGGNRRWVYRNILCTFLASALLLHTGFLGSPWPSVDPGQLRDWVLYFGAQGLLLCAAHWWVQRPFWEDLSPLWARPLAVLGWAFTLASSAWLHVLPLAAGDLLNMSGAPVDSLSQRFALMFKALGF
jgi:alginate O-acetyltransferase complex protein AlgI